MVILLVVAVALLVAPIRVSAQGFGIYELSACAMARGAAGVAQPCDDGSAIAVNPAAIAGHEGITFGSGGLLVFGTGSFTSDDSTRTSLERTVALAPYGYFAYGVNSRLAVGIGGYAPYGLSVAWPLEFEGRFVSFDSTLKTLYLQPTVAYALTSALSVGGGATIARSSVELNRREDLATVPLGATGLSFGALVNDGTDFATTQLSASGATGVGFNVGMRLQINDRMQVGAKYLSAITLSYEGEATFAPTSGSIVVTKANPLGLPIGTPLDPLVGQVLSNLPNQQARTELEMPAQFVVGLALRPTAPLTIFADYQWVGWSVFDTVTLDFANASTPDEQLVQDYRDTGALRLGVEYALSPGLQLRSGYAYTQAAAPDQTVTPLLPEAQRDHLMVGAGWTFRPRMTLDVAYHFVAHADRRGRVVNRPPGSNVDLNSGVYRSRGDLLGITLTYRR
jgi:long-chain fatty acid transport protein